MELAGTMTESTMCDREQGREVAQQFAEKMSSFAEKLHTVLDSGSYLEIMLAAEETAALMLQGCVIAGPMFAHLEHAERTRIVTSN